MTVQRICKPHLVDFLRMCDRNRWCCPRIRYASIRSKPELCRDLLSFFKFEKEGESVRIVPIRPIHRFPLLEYNLKTRTFHVDGVVHDFPRMSRARPEFRLVRKPVTLEFGALFVEPGSGISAVSALGFPLQGMSTVATG